MVRGFDLKPYFLVAPTDIAEAFTDNWHNIWEAMKVSGTNAAVGLAVGTLFGVVLSFLLARFRLLDELVTPLSIALNAIPAFVLVSVFNNMFSSTSEVPRRLMVTIVVFFVVLVNVSKGLRQVAPVHAELMHSYAASGWQLLGKVRVPNAVPYLFTGAANRRAAVGDLRLRVRILRWCRRTVSASRISQQYRQLEERSRAGPTWSAPASSASPSTCSSHS